MLRVLLKAIFVLALIVQPLGALSHALSHLDEAAHAGEHGQPQVDSACELCVASAHAAAPPVMLVVSAAGTADLWQPPVSHQSPVTNQYCRYHARAPPRLA
jgi:hypothetical protein